MYKGFAALIGRRMNLTTGAAPSIVDDVSAPGDPVRRKNIEYLGERTKYEKKSFFLIISNSNNDIHILRNIM